ncbi:katanin p80 WD40 repeat-containing subunit B1-like protein isoform X1 [Gossypium australe]|uniref:Katanin p80 WD40 repeat-containing subunit B1-like protein isoform X1 n=1 Tax=Gossypium australe TaxID=47621 RepID=A0A5B6VGA5_9ROSI|nr:katanin p80 WD40 repeat-containing subunit B1-like protein isoform X1 [Gossypium australe]
MRFTPDGRWVVSGGEDNIVKVWDLTAGKLLHQFKDHEGQIQCLDFHPHEFLLATGSADRTVKFWDLETFELIGSAGPETAGVRCLTFNPDGRTVLCGLHENLKVFSWEPIRCYDGVDVGWSRLSDLNVHEGKLLGCSYNQSCVGVWVVDISRIEPYAVGNAKRVNGHSEPKSHSGGNLSVLNENTTKASMGRLPVSQNPDPLVKETKSLGRLSISQNSDPAKESKSTLYFILTFSFLLLVQKVLGETSQIHHSELLNFLTNKTTKVEGKSGLMDRRYASLFSSTYFVSSKSYEISGSADGRGCNHYLFIYLIFYILVKATGNAPGTPHRVNLNAARKTAQQRSVTVPRRSSTRANSAVTVPTFSKSDVVPVLVPRNDMRSEQAAELRKEVGISEGSLEQVTESRREVGITGRSLESSQSAAESRKEAGIVGRTLEQGADSRKELGIVGRTMPFSLQSKTSSFRKFQNSREELDWPAISAPPENAGSRVEFSSDSDRSTLPSVKGPINGMSAAEMNMREDRCIGSVRTEPNSVVELPSSYQDENYDAQVQKSHRDAYPLESQKGGRTRSVILNLEKRRRSNFDGPTLCASPRNASVANMPSFDAYKQRRRYSSSVEKEMPSATDEDAVADVMEQHDQFIGSMQSRLAKLQVVHRLWERNDIKGAISAMEKMSDHGVLADVMSIVTEKIDIVTLEICTSLLPLLSGLLGSDMDRHLSICLDMLLKLVRIFGSMIYSTLSALAPAGVDIEAEQRFERCNLCFIELEKVKQCLPNLTRRGGSVAKSAQELNLALQEVS